MEEALGQLSLGCIPSREKRQLKQNYKKAIFEANNVARRLVWVRETLELRAIDVYTKLNIPAATFCDREAGLRTSFYEELRALSRFYNKAWQDRFLNKTSFPKYEDKEVVQVTVPWIMFGEDEVLEEMLKTIDTITNNFREREKEMSRELLELKARKGAL